MKDNLNQTILTRAFAVLGAWIYIVALGLLLMRVLPNSEAVTAQALRDFAISADSIAPEAVERTLYLLGLLTSPFVVLFLEGWIKNRGWGESLLARLKNDPTIRWVVLALGVGLVLFGHRINNANGYLFLRPSLAWQRPEIFFGGVGLILVLGAWLKPKSLIYARKVVQWVEGRSPIFCFLVVAPILIWAAGIRTVGENDPYQFRFHFQSLSSPILQTYNGKTLLLDQFPLYGLYGSIIGKFLRWLTPNEPMSIASVAKVFWVLSSFSILSWAFFCLTAIRSRILGVITLFATLAFSLFAVPYEEYHHYGVMVDSYFQYLPVRTVFPGVLFLILALVKGNRISNLGFTLGALFFACAAYWNFDTGLVCLGTWGLVGVADRFSQKGFLPKLLPLGICVGAFGAMYWLHFILFRLTTGSPPNWYPMMHTNSILYTTGINAINMPILHPWIFLVTLLWIGILVTWRLVSRGEVTAQTRALVATISFGAGLFLYYQGRSHDYTFFACTYPVLFLAGVLLDLARGHLSRNKPLRVLCFVPGFFLVAWAVSFVWLAADTQARVKERENIPLKSNPEWARAIEGAEWFRTQVKPGETAFVLSDLENNFHRLGQTRAFNSRGWVELFPMSRVDLAILVERLTQVGKGKGGPVRVFASRAFLVGQTVIDPEILNAMKRVLAESFREGISHGDVVEFLGRGEG